VARPSDTDRPVGVRLERRVKFARDELPLDILALLVSCGQRVRAEDAQALKADPCTEDSNAVGDRPSATAPRSFPPGRGGGTFAGAARSLKLFFRT